MENKGFDWEYEELSFVNSLTNDVNIPAMGLPELESLLKNKPLSEDHLQLFLHESTHNWCFQSLVGDTMAIMEAFTANIEQEIFNGAMQFHRASKDTAEFLKQNKKDVDILEQNKLKLVIAKRLLSPLLEGIALFVELDLEPDLAFVVPPLDCCQRLFTTSRTQGKKRFLDRLSKLRITGSRKLDLFLSSYGFGSGGHLRGYLFIKSIYERFVCLSPVAVDSQAFIFFVKSLFMDCPAMGHLFSCLEEQNHAEFYEEFVKVLEKKSKQLLDIDFCVSKIGAQCKRSLIALTKKDYDFIYLGIDENKQMHSVGEYLRHSLHSIIYVSMA